MPADARVSAWILAWKTLEAAKELYKPKGINSSVIEAHQVLLAEADVLTRLACAPEEIGEAVGEILQQKEIERRRTQETFEAFLAEAKEAKHGGS